MRRLRRPVLPGVSDGSDIGQSSDVLLDYIGTEENTGKREDAEQKCPPESRYSVRSAPRCEEGRLARASSSILHQG